VVVVGVLEGVLPIAGKVSPSSSFLSQLGGELVAAAGLALLKTRSERTHALPYICSLVVSSEVSTSVCVCVWK